MLLVPRAKATGSLSSSRAWRAEAAPGKDKPPPTRRMLPYSFFFISREAGREGEGRGRGGGGGGEFQSWL